MAAIKNKKILKSHHIDPNEKFYVIDPNGIFAIQGGELVGSIKEEDFIHEIQKAVPTKTELLPDRCIFYQRTKRFTFVILEYPPAMRKVNYVPKDGEHSKEPFKGEVFYPYLYVIFKLSTENGIALYHSYITSRVNKLTSLEDDVYFVHIPNTNESDCGICWGNQKMSADKSSLAAFVNTTMDGFWQSNTNGDLRLKIPKLKSFVMPREAGYTEVLEALSKINIDEFLIQGAYQKYGPISNFLRENDF